MEKQVEFKSGKETLRGSLFIPKGKGPFPGVIFFHGRGSDRKNYLGMGKNLSENGVITLAFDFRGCGDSEGDFKNQTHRMGIEDAEGGLKFVLSQNTDKNRIGLLGSSFGGYCAAMLVNRYDYIKFLKESGVNIRLFGLGWEKYDDLKSIYGGFLNTKDLIEVYNKTKINLNFSKGALPGSKKGQLKGRILEIPASQNFILIEEFPSLKYIYPNYYKKICFKDKNELLKKIEYFLKNEEERENIAKGLRKQVIDNYSWESQIESIFTKIAFGDKKLIRKDFPRSGKRIVILSESDLKLDFLELNKKIKEFDYIMLNSNDSVSLKWRNYIQSYSLEKSGKDISCCDYYVSNKILGDYLLFTAKKAFYNIPRKDFNEMLTIGQIMVKKDFFLRNIDKFKDKKIDFVNENNTIFVSIPLIKLNNIKYKSEYNIMSKAFKAKFIDNIYSLIYQKKIIYNGYIYKLVAHSLLYGENFVLFHLYKSILNKENFNKIKKWLL